MSTVSVAAGVLTALSKAGAVQTTVDQVEAAVTKFVQLAEQAGGTGDAKLTAVLNATNAFIGKIAPELNVDFTALGVQVSGFVAGLVSLWNALGVFVKDVQSGVKAAGAAIKAAV